MNERKRKVGAEIAGPAVALFLKRVGFEVEIYEARTTPEGYALLGYRCVSCHSAAK